MTLDEIREAFLNAGYEDQSISDDRLVLSNQRGEGVSFVMLDSGVAHLQHGMVSMLFDAILPDEESDSIYLASNKVLIAKIH